MQKQKQFICTLGQNDLAAIEQLINNFPLGNCNVAQANQASMYAQKILDFMSGKMREVVAPEPEESEKKA